VRDTYGDTSYGKFDSPMANYCYHRLMLEGVSEDASASTEHGDWAIAYGRRILHGDDRGFVYLSTWDTTDEAIRRVIEQDLEWNTCPACSLDYEECNCD